MDLDRMVECSKEISQDCEQYSHSLYQCAIAAISISQQQLVRVVEMPTGSGKTWIYGLIAKHYLNQGKRVTIIEPNEHLCVQTTELLGNIGLSLTITFIDQFYEMPSADEVVILNEYHHIVQAQPFEVSNDQLVGIWTFQNRQLFCCTATTDRELERILMDIVATPAVLKFQSEYELVNKLSPTEGGEIKPCKTRDVMLETLELDIEKHYEIKPIIIVAAKEDEDEVVDLLCTRKWNKYATGISGDTLREIRTWSYGILVINPCQALGVNTRFACDSVVLITSRVGTRAEYLQLIGRSSRTRGLCCGVYYPVTNFNSYQVMELMKSSNLTALQQLAKLLKFLGLKRNSSALVEAVGEALANKEKITSMKDVKSILSAKDYNKLIKGYQF